MSGCGYNSYGGGKEQSSRIVLQPATAAEIQQYLVESYAHVARTNYLTVKSVSPLQSKTSSRPTYNYSEDYSDEEDDMSSSSMSLCSDNSLASSRSFNASRSFNSSGYSYSGRQSPRSPSMSSYMSDSLSTISNMSLARSPNSRPVSSTVRGEPGRYYGDSYSKCTGAHRKNTFHCGCSCNR